MNSHPINVGEISLNLSFCLYLIHFLPQLWHNFQQKKTHQLSLLMHMLLIIGYSADLLYGYGQHMQWQYITVSCVGVACLLIQHVQIGLAQKTLKKAYVTATTCLIPLTIIGIFCLLYHQHLNSHFFIIAGLISQATWFAHGLPQIYKNHQEKVAAGLSLYYLLVSILISVCDLTSAYYLHWSYPSKIGPWISMAIAACLILQQQKYKIPQLRQPLTY